MLGRQRKDISRHFLIDGREVFDPGTIADEFVNYFADHPKSIQDDILAPQDDYTDLIPLSGCTFVLHDCTPDKMYAATKRLKKEGSISDISAKFLNMCGINLSVILCKLFNLCLHEASYPDIFKCSRITPLYKKNERTVIDNHRPISSLCNISKVFDTLLHE